MTNQKQNIWTLFLAAVMILWLGACSSHHGEEPDAWEWDGELCLLLRVDVLESGSDKATRAPGDDGQYGFEEPAFSTEKMHTLRVIIVDTRNDSIAHNKISPVEGGGNSLNGLKFKVDFSTKYDIYLIANEEALSDDIKDILRVKLDKGKTYPENELENLDLSVATAGNPYIDNSKTRSLIPMTEKYEVTTVDRPVVNQEHISVTMEKNFFITRALSKFSFHFYKSEDYKGDNALQIKKIRITGIGDKEYLLPTETVYSPEKDVVSNNLYGGRIIKEFKLPDGAEVAPHTFSILTDGTSVLDQVGNLPVWNEQNPEKNWGNTYIPELYFAESMGNSDQGDFMCSISFDGENFTPPVKLPNLSSLPRNTHVIVNVTVGNDGVLFFKVKVDPWDRQNHVIDFTHNVGMAEDGALTFVPGTFAELYKDTGRLILNDYPNAASGSFGISSPIGCRWTAYLVTRSGELNVIQFQVTDDQGNTTTSPFITGFIDGKKTDFKVVATQSAGNETRSAVLQVVVTMADGLSVPVNILKSTEYGKDVENIIFVQNPQ